MLTLDKVSARYGLSPVLSGISLSAGDGEAIAILGRNGAGKTTLLRAIVGLHPVHQGRIVFNAQEMTGRPAVDRALAGMAYVPQGRGIFPHLSVAENLRVGIVARRRRPGFDRTLPDHIFALFPALKAMLGRKAGVLSGGEQQQLAIARALLCRPSLLLLDEPTEGIQPSVVEQIEQALQAIRRELAISLLLVEQYLEFAWSVADRYYVVQKGSVVDQGATHESSMHEVAELLTV